MNTYYKAAIRNQKELMPGIWKMELVAPEIAHSARPGTAASAGRYWSL